MNQRPLFEIATDLMRANARSFMALQELRRLRPAAVPDPIVRISERGQPPAKRIAPTPLQPPKE